jgi:mRNA-degrading endonuclease toxin of MazEF toxin-antitoxin module
VVIPLSTSPQPSAPLLVPVRCDGREVVAVTDQIRAIAKLRLDRRLGELSLEDLEAVEQGVREVLGTVGASQWFKRVHDRAIP